MTVKDKAPNRIYLIIQDLVYYNRGSNNTIFHHAIVHFSKINFIVLNFIKIIIIINAAIKFKYLFFFFIQNANLIIKQNKIIKRDLKILKKN